MLDTTELVVKKVWQGDNNEIYITRPASTVTRYDWEVTFVVQRSMDGGATWQDIPANAQVTLYGENSQDEVNQAIKGLPTFAFNDAGQLIPCRYRVLEMQSAEVAAGAQRELLEEGASFGNEMCIRDRDMPLLDTRERGKGLIGAFVADLVLQILSYVAQTERENIRQRQMEGIAAAKLRGVRFGRPRKSLPPEFAGLRAEGERGDLSSREAAMQLKIAQDTFLRWAHGK